MRRVGSIVSAILFISTIAHAQTSRLPTTATACKKPSGINVFINLDARPTAFSNGSQKAHISPARSSEFVSRVEAKLEAQGFCVFHNDEFDGAGKASIGMSPGTSPHIDIAFLAHVESFPASTELLVYSMHFGDWTTQPLLPYYLLNDESDIAALTQGFANSVKEISTR